MARWHGVLFIVSLVLNTPLVSTFTDIGGVVDRYEVWKRDKSPYVARQNVLITDDGHLVIEPGVVVYFQAGFGITVRGILKAQGTSSNRIQFVREKGKHYDSPNFNGENIRLVDGPSILEGKLQLFHNQKWRNVCASQNWTKFDYNVTCRHLGFVSGEFYEWFDHEPNVPSIELTSPECVGNETTLRSCNWSSRRMGKGVCDLQPFIGIRCHPYLNISQPNQHNWRGIWFQNAKSKESSSQGKRVTLSDSVLEFIDVFHAGNNRTGALSSALEIIGVPPRMHNVTIRSSGYNGINISECFSPVEISNSVITDNKGHGIFINSSEGSVQIDNSEIIGNGGNGIHYINYYDTYLLKTPLDFCTSPDIGFSQEYPANFFFYQANSSHPTSCFRVFRTENKQILTIHFLRIMSSANESGIVTVRDGERETSPLLMRYKISNFTKPLSIASTSSYIRIDIEMKTSVECQLALKVDVDFTKASDLKVIKSRLERNGGVGLHVENMRSFLQVADSIIEDNRYFTGIFVKGGTGDVNVSGSAINNNVGDGLNINLDAGRVNITYSELSSNEGRGMVSHIGKMSHDELFESKTVVSHSIITKNKKYGLEIGPQDVINITMTVFRVCYDIAIKIKDGSIDYSGMEDRTRKLFITNNLFSLNRHVSIEIPPIPASSIAVEHNQFSDNQKECLVFLKQRHYIQENPWSIIQVRENLFEKNNGIFVASLYIPHSTNHSLVFTHNYLDDNNVRNPFPTLNSRSHVAAVITIQSPNVDIYRNQFRNLRSKYEIASQVIGPYVTVNCTHNSFGTTDIRKIYPRVFDCKYRYHLSCINFKPYLRVISDLDTAYISDTSEVHIDPFHSTESNNNEIGGHISGRERLQEGTYTVTRDIYLKPQSTLSIGPNVQLIFDDGIGVMIQGKVDFRGIGQADHERVIFTSSGRVFPTETEARLASVSEDRVDFIHEGRLEIKIEENWGTVCNHGWNKEVAALVCHQMGLEFNPNDWEFKPRKLRNVYSEVLASNVRCHFLDTVIRTCEFDTMTDIENTCTHDDDVHLRCYEPTWAGLRFGLAAEESLVEHVTIEKAGYYDYDTDLQYSALQVDFMHHNIKSIILKNNLHVGFGVVFHDYFYNLDKMKISDSNIGFNFGHGIYTHTPGLNVNNVLITNNTESGIHFDPFISRAARQELASWVAPEQKIRQYVVSLATINPSVIDLKSGTSVFVITEVMEVNRESRIRFRTDAGGVFGIQVLNPVWKNSTEVLQISDADTRTVFWTSAEDTTTFPTIAPFSTLLITCNSGSRALGGAVFYITALEDNQQMIESALNPQLKIFNSTLESNFDGLKTVHHDDTIDFDDNWNPRVLNQSINIQYTRFRQQQGAAISVTSVYSPGNHDEVVNTSYTIDHTNITDNKIGIIEAADDLLNSKQIINWHVTNTIWETNEGTALNLTLPYVWNSTEPAYHDIYLRKNLFSNNKNFSIFLNGYFTKLSMIQNKFLNNACPNELITISGMEKEIWISRNAFEENTAQRLIKFDINSNTKLFNKVEAHFKNNFVINNTGPGKSSGKDFKNFSYTMGIFGLQFMNVTNNFLGPNKFEYDFVCGIKVNSMKNRMDARENWWGTSNVATISTRILDFEDSSNYAPVEFIPFFTKAALNPELLSYNTVPITMSFNNMGGRLHDAWQLKKKDRPYIVKSDLIVMPDATLTIEAGVEMTFHSGVGMLVLGTLVAEGTYDQMVIFRPFIHQTKTKRAYEEQEVLEQSIRLCFQGDCERKRSGFLEVFNETVNQWVPVCDSAFTEANAQVVCNMLNDKTENPTEAFVKFGIRHDFEERAFKRIQSWLNPVTCSGQETTLNDCNQRVGIDLSCAMDSEFVFVYCLSAPRRHNYWGGITFASHSYERRVFKGTSDADPVVKRESLLDHVLISGAGNLHGEKTSGIQAIYKLPKIVNSEIMKGASHGVTIVAPMTHIDITRTQFKFNRGFGLNVLDFRSDTRETSFPLELPLRPLHLPSELFGMVDMCSADKSIAVTDRILIYYKYSSNPATCVKVFEGMQHLGFRLLHFNMFKNYGKNIDFVRVYDGDIASDDKEELKVLRGDVKEGRVVVKSQSSKISVQVVANSASEIHGFVAEIFSVPPVTITFDEDIHHKISHNSFEANLLGAIYYSSFGEVNPTLKLSSNVFLDNSIELAENFSSSNCAVSLNLQNSHSLKFSRNLLMRNQGGFCLTAESDSRLSSLQGSIVNNLFIDNVNHPVLVLKSQQLTYYQVVINNNAFIFNNVSYHAVIFMDEIVSTVTNNYIFNNTGFHTLYSIFDAEQSHRVVYQMYRHNIFLNNTARSKSTIFLGSSGQSFIENVFINPNNDFEMESAIKDDEFGMINATKNWWGFNYTIFVSSRIREKEDDDRRIAIQYSPFLESKRSLIDDDCLPGWERIGGACHHYFGGRMDKWEAEQFCNNLNATVSYVKSSDVDKFVRLLRTTQAIYDSKSPVRVQIIEFVPSGGCSAVLGNEIESVSCHDKYSFFCAWGVNWEEIEAERNWQLGILIGGCVGGFVFILLIILLCVCRCYCKKRSKEKKQKASTANAASKEELDYLTYARPKGDPEEDGKSLDEDKKSLSQETLPLMGKGQKPKAYLETSLDYADADADDDIPKKKFLETSLDNIDKDCSEA